MASFSDLLNAAFSHLHMRLLFPAYLPPSPVFSRVSDQTPYVANQSHFPFLSPPYSVFYLLRVCKNGGEHHKGTRFCSIGVVNVYLGRQTREGAEGMYFICLVPIDPTLLQGKVVW